MSSNPPRKHHYLPEFYSKKWISSDGRLIRISKPMNTIIHKWVFPSQVGFEIDLYRIPGLSPIRSQQLELSFFKQVDNRAAMALQRINELQAKSLKDPEIRTALALFILSLIHRTPSNFEAFKFGLMRLLQMPDPTVQRKYEVLKAPSDPNSYEEFLQLGDPLSNEKLALSLVPKLINHQELGTHMVNMTWDLIELSTAKHALMCSDTPLVMSNGIGNSDGHICLPIAPNRALLLSANREIRGQILGLSPNQIVRRLNLLVVERSRHFVVASDLRQLPFVKKHFGANPVPSWPQSLLAKYETEFG